MLISYIVFGTLFLWFFCRDYKRPKEHVVVWTTTNSGVTQKLVRVGNLWFMPEMSMYVYYQPLKWRCV